MGVFQKRIGSLQHGKHVEDVDQFLMIFVTIFFHLITSLLWDRASDSDQVVGSLVISPWGTAASDSDSVVGSLVISPGGTAASDNDSVVGRLVISPGGTAASDNDSVVGRLVISPGGLQVFQWLGGW